MMNHKPKRLISATSGQTKQLNPASSMAYVAQVAVRMPPFANKSIV